VIGAYVYRNSTVDRRSGQPAAHAAAAPPDKLDPQELEALERSTIEAQGRLDVVTMFLAIEDGGLRKLAKLRTAPGLDESGVEVAFLRMQQIAAL
jgi:hypothetical protein